MSSSKLKDKSTNELVAHIRSCVDLYTNAREWGEGYTSAYCSFIEALNELASRTNHTESSHTINHVNPI
jgi:hypothetical protein